MINIDLKHIENAINTYNVGSSIQDPRPIFIDDITETESGTLLLFSKALGIVIKLDKKSFDKAYGGRNLPK